MRISARCQNLNGNKCLPLSLLLFTSTFALHLSHLVENPPLTPEYSVNLFNSVSQPLHHLLTQIPLFSSLFSLRSLKQISKAFSIKMAKNTTSKSESISSSFSFLRFSLTIFLPLSESPSSKKAYVPLYSFSP